MGWLADKLRKWEEAIDREAAPGAGSRVTAGGDGLTADPAVLSRWTAEAMERLAAEVPDPAARRRIMLDRSCVFAEEFGDADLDALRALFQETGSAPAVVSAMRENPDRFGDPFIDGGVIVEIRRPRDPEAFAAAKTRHERQSAACFCPLARESGDRLPLEYCSCSAGWYRGIYGSIFGVPVEVEVNESLLNGDGRCRFTIRVPGVLDGRSPA
jgi:hypothetical protein